MSVILFGILYLFTFKKLLRPGFWSGMMMGFCYFVLFQDFLGKEAYVNWVSTHWHNVPWLVWLAFTAWIVIDEVLASRKIKGKGNT